MRRSRFVAPKRVESFEDVRKALARLQETLDASQPKRGALITKDTTLRAGESVRISPRGGATLFAKLPKASAENYGETISILLERPAGTLRVSAQAPDTVVGASATNYTTAGLIVLQSNGVDAWVSAAELPSTSPGGAALDAEYLVGAAHGSLPNARVATDSTEIDADLTVANVASWALRTASVAFSKLANLTGLSVLGRAANSAGVMAAITATAARQTLRNNDAGTALEWGHPVEVRDSGADQGDAYALDFVAGTNVNIAASVAGGVATITPSVDLSSVTYTAGDGIDLTGQSFSADVSDFAGGGLEDDGSNNLRTAAVTGAISRAAGATASLFAGIRDNGTLETARGFINVLSTSTITAAIAQDAGNNEQEWSWSVNLAADYDWTGEHWFSGPVFFDDPADANIAVAGDIRAVSLVVHARSSLTLATEAGTGDITIQSGLSGTLQLTAGNYHVDADDYVDISANDDVWLNGDSIILTSGVNTPGAGGTSGGFMQWKESSASTPTVAAGFGMQWVIPATAWGGSSPCVPMFTDDTNVDHEIAMVGPPATIQSFGSGDVSKGSVFCLTKAIVSSGSASAGDAAVFTTGTAPFSFRILFAGYFPTTPGGASATLTLRDTASGGGLTMGAMNVDTPGSYQTWLGGATKLDPVILAGGQLYARCSRRDFSGILWMLCVRTA